MTPQGEDAVSWRRAHPAYILLQMLSSLRGMVFPLIIVGVSTGALSDAITDRNFRRLGIFGAILLVYLVVVFLWNYMEWRFFRYALAPQRLLVRTGWISRQERSVPYARIQAVDVVETPVYRIIGLARLRIETASGGSLEGSEVDIKAISRDQAMHVREQLLRARHAVRADDPAPVEGFVVEEGALREAGEVQTEGELVRAMSTRELLIAGATSGTIGPAAAVIGGVISFADDLVPNSWWERVPWDEIESLSTSITIIGSLVIIIALLAWLMAIAGTVITYYGYELRKSDEHLFVQHGLLDKRRATIPVRRIQAIRVEEGLLRQPFGFVTLKYSSAGQGVQHTGGSGTLFPFMPRREVRALLNEVTPEFAVDLDSARFHPLPKRALPRYIVMDTFWMAVVAAAAMIGIRYWRDGLPWWGYLPLVIVPFQIVMGWLSYRDAGWSLDNGLLLLRSRSVVRSTLIASRRRIQHRSTTANPFQRRASLVTMHVAVASGIGGGSTSLAHMERRDGEQLLFALNPRAVH